MRKAVLNIIREIKALGKLERQDGSDISVPVIVELSPKKVLKEVLILAPLQRWAETR